MAIFIQCPICKRKQKMAHKKCVYCNEDLTKAKKMNRVRYWVSLTRNSFKFWKSVGFSLSEAKIEEIKLKGSPHLGRVKISFAEIAKLYLDSSVKRKKYFPTVKIRIAIFLQIFGSSEVSLLKLTDIENLQNKRLDAGWSPATIDQEISAVKTMLHWAVSNELTNPVCLSPWNKSKKLLKPLANSRSKVLSLSEFYALLSFCDPILQTIVSLGFFCGMRLGEILNLTWDKIHLNVIQPFILLDATDTKEGKTKLIPIPSSISLNPLSLLKSLPRAINSKSKVFELSYHQFRRSFILSCEKARIPFGRFKPNGLIFHDLRHSFVTNMRRAGVDLLSTMLITGHAIPRDFAIAMRYNQFTSEDLYLSVSKMESFLMSQPNYKESSVFNL